MRRHKIASQILLILSIFNFVLAAPVAVREINEVRVNAVDTAKVRMAVSEKRMDPEDQSSTNAGYLTNEEVSWSTASSYSTGSSELDTATSRRPLSNLGQAGSPSPSHSVSTDDPPPQSPQPAPDLPPPSSPQPAPDSSPPSSPKPAPDSSHPPPSNPGPSTGPQQPTDDHSPPSMEPQHPEAPESENILSKLMKGKFKRRISGYGILTNDLMVSWPPQVIVSSAVVQAHPLTNSNAKLRDEDDRLPSVLLVTRRMLENLD
ncbi:hypothetical protein F5888DRAFT_1892444 [Russula emetica]|nr:hypothetical protein F5888DRAFT_1892444 [Russula emetica]